MASVLPGEHFRLLSTFPQVIDRRLLTEVLALFAESCIPRYLDCRMLFFAIFLLLDFMLCSRRLHLLECLEGHPLSSGNQEPMHIRIRINKYGTDYS